MRQLLEQQEKRKEQLKTAPKPVSDNSLLSVADEAFLRKVLQYIEQNLDNPEYSVEVLSRDMGRCPRPRLCSAECPGIWEWTAPDYIED